MSGRNIASAVGKMYRPVDFKELDFVVLDCPFGGVLRLAVATPRLASFGQNVHLEPRLKFRHNLPRHGPKSQV